MTENKQTFGLQKIYLKDVSFESPAPVKNFTNSVKPKMNVDIDIASSKIDNDNYEITLHITLSAENEAEKSVIYLAEVKQSGIFHMANFKDNELEAIMKTQCPNILFPYARENISNLIVKAGFAQFLLMPVNFEALFMQHKKAQQEQKDSTDKAH